LASTIVSGGFVPWAETSEVTREELVNKKIASRKVPQIVSIFIDWPPLARLIQGEFLWAKVAAAKGYPVCLVRTTVNSYRQEIITINIRERLVDWLIRQLFSKPPGISGVTPFAHAEVIIAKGTLAVVTRHTTLPASGGVMIERLGLGNLPALRHAGPDLMTFAARGLFMLVVTKTDAKGLRRLRRP
jgi:hypothetical protein